jgi:hypothetical protein
MPTSQINTASDAINIGFPVQGTDNPSAGFRNNFASIQQAFTQADNEITEIFATAVFNTGTNNYNQNILQNAVLQTYSVYNANQLYNLPVGGAIAIDATLGNYQKLQLSSATNTISITWAPSTGFNFVQKVQLEFTNQSTFTNVSVTIEPTSGGQVLCDSSKGVNKTFSISQAANPVIYEVQTIDNGQTQLLSYFGGPYV